MNAALTTTGRAIGGLRGAICLLAAFVALPTSLPAAEKAPVVKGMRDAATHDTIVETDRVAREEAAREQVKQQQQQALKPVPPEQRPPPPEKKSILASSDILAYRGEATLVPKRAVLHKPKGMEDKIGMQDGARFVDFQEFLTQNRSWLTTADVNRPQAEGNEPLSEALLKSFAKETRVVIATYNGGPISVLPLKVPPPTETVDGKPATGKPAAPVAANAAPNTNAQAAQK